MRRLNEKPISYLLKGRHIRSFSIKMYIKMRTPHKFDRFLIPPNPSSIVSNITLLHIYQSYLPILLVDNGSSRDNCKSGTSRTAQSRRQNRDCTKLVHRPSFSGLSAKHRPAYGEVPWRMLTRLGVCSPRER